MAVVGLLATIALYIIGIPGALLLGIFSGLVAFVPIIGSIAGAIPPILLAFAGSPLDALWVVLAYVVIQQIESNLLTPLVMQQAVSLHPRSSHSLRNDRGERLSGYSGRSWRYRPPWWPECS